jgi:predicted DNA-binding transcriptional regulator YafY
MPYNKDAYTRYKLIDTCIRRKSKPAPSLSDLVEYISDKLGRTVSESSIQKDIFAMRNDSNLGFNAPIAYDYYKKGYVYTEEDYFIEKLPVSEDELQGLEMCLGFLQQFTSIPSIKIFEESIARMAQSVKQTREKGSKSAIVVNDKNKKYAGAQYMKDIVYAIQERKVVKIQYQSFTRDKAKEHTIHPYFIKEFSDRLYLVANDVAPGKMEKFLTFSFDRIQQLQLTNTTFKEEFIDRENYFSNTLGVSNVGDTPEQIILACSNTQLGYFKTQPIHHSQKIISESDKGFSLSLNLVVNTELIMRILSYGVNVKVMEPASLRDKIAATCLAMSKQYGGKN